MIKNAVSPSPSEGLPPILYRWPVTLQHRKSIIDAIFDVANQNFFVMPINWKPVILLATKYWPAYWPKNNIKTNLVLLVSFLVNLIDSVFWILNQNFWLVNVLTFYKPNEYTQYPVPFYEQTLHAKLRFFKSCYFSQMQLRNVVVNPYKMSAT